MPATTGVLVANLGHNPTAWMRAYFRYMNWPATDAPVRGVPTGSSPALPMTAYNALTPVEVEATARAHDGAVKEVILALNATVDGQTTAHYITDMLRDADVKVTRLAYGVPVGGELDYLDEGTLSAAIKQRTPF